jgi:hypothetical protein
VGIPACTRRNAVRRAARRIVRTRPGVGVARWRCWRSATSWSSSACPAGWRARWTG